MYTNAMASGQPHSMRASVTLHSVAANRPDQPSPSTTCAIRKAAQSERMRGGSSERTSNQL